MADLKITTVNEFDNGGVFPHRSIRVGDKKVQTPAAARLPRDLQKSESYHPGSDGICELYRTVGGDDLDEAMRDPEDTQINADLEEQWEKVGDDELAVAFTSYKETHTLEPPHASYLAELHGAYSDIITVPMMPRLVRNIEEGVEDPSYLSLKQSIHAFLHQVQERFPEKPVVGLVPRLGWEYVDDLIGVYREYGITAFAFDFNRRKVTAGTQVAMIGR